jgi:kynurenine formamidase
MSTGATDPQAFSALAGARWVDLSLLVSERLPTWPFHMPFQRKVWNWFAQPSELPGQTSRSDQAFQTAWWTMDEHVGTHFDAPTHFIPPPDSGLPHASPLGAVSGDLVSIDLFHGPACVLDARSLVGQADGGVSPEIGWDIVEAFELEHGRIDARDVVVFASGWDRFYEEGEAGSGYALDVVQGRCAGWPAPSVETIGRLYEERGVRTLATDGCSVGSSHDGFAGHYAGLGRGMAYVEGLAHLEELPARGSYFVFLPVKVAGSSGGPGRAVGILPGG